MVPQPLNKKTLEIKSPSNASSYQQGVKSATSVKLINTGDEDFETLSQTGNEGMLNPLLSMMKANRIGRNTLHRRHQSVAPRCMEKAEAQQMYISPSKLNIGIKDSIYQGSAKNSRNDLHLQQ